jgi:deazaflavin-dependent oxidoreductase (nitroreductase family)
VTNPSPNTPKTYQRSRFHRAENLLTRALTRVGLIPRSYVLTTVGRKSGQERRNPVTVVDLDGRQWLVAPYGVVSWVLNARAAGEVRLTRRLTTTRYTVRQVGPEESGPVLKEYVTVASVPRPYFAATVDDPPEAFAREADRHPVMQLVPVTTP